MKDKESDNSTLVASFAIVGTLLMAIVSAIYSGFVLSKIWQWYVVPYGAPAVSFGVFTILLLALLTIVAKVEDQDYYSKNKEEIMAEALWRKPLRYSFLLVIGYVVQLFVTFP
jgi:hypothetical protein